MAGVAAYRQADAAVNAAITQLKELLGAPKESYSKSAVDACTHSIERVAAADGLDGGQLVALARIAAEAKDDHVKRRLVRAMYPRDKVPEEVVVPLLSVLSSTTSLSIKLMMITWLRLVLDRLDSQRTISACYGVFFHFIDYDTLRPVLCQILYKITRKQHVLGFRCRRLMDLYRRVGHEGPLAMLLAVYKAYAPTLVTLVMPRTSPAALRVAGERGWQQVMERISGQLVRLGPEPLRPGLSTLGPGALRRKERYLPAIRAGADDKPTVTVSDLTSIEELAQSLDRLALPAQVAAVLENRWLQHFVAVVPNRSTTMRLSHWLTHALDELHNGLEPTPETQAQLRMLMQRLLAFGNLIQEGSVEVEDFLVSYLARWNDLHQYLSPLNNLFIVSSASWKADLIRCYTAMLARWARLIQHHYFRPGGPLEAGLHVLQPLKANVSYLDTMREFIAHVDKLCVLGLQHAVLGFWETAVAMPTDYDLPFVVPPSQYIVYHLALSPHAFAVARVCAVLERYKRAYDVLKQKGRSDSLKFPGPDQPVTGIESINDFNKYVSDLCNLIWRQRIADERNTLPSFILQMPPHVVQLCQADPEAARAVSLSHSPGTIAMARKFVQTAFAQAGFATQTVAYDDLSLRRLQQLSNLPVLELRKKLLEYLASQCGMTGIRTFLSAFVATLRPPAADAA